MNIYKIKIGVFIATVFLVVSCAPQKEIVRAPEILSPAPVQPPKQEIKVPLAKYKSFLQCDERNDFFNSSGIEVLPFMRVNFFDIDGDGVNEMIAGSKDGSLRLYRNSGSRDVPQWGLDAHYFDGVSAGVFSAPAAGDIDGDGKPEILIGTGGFSKDSGRVIFFKNKGTPIRPIWKRMDLPEINVGNDATPALFDVDNDGRADLIVGNSTGNLFLFRATRTGKGIAFVKDTAYFKGVQLGMYVVPAVTAHQNKILIIAGNGMGKLYVLERGYESRSAWQKSALSLSLSSFASPAFISSNQPGVMDMVLSDGNGQLSYYRNKRNNYRDWSRKDDFFSVRILTGPVSAPVITEFNGSSFMVVGNIKGEIRLFVNELSPAGQPWVERQGFFSSIKLPGFAHGILTEWKGSPLLITGQQDGIIRAFRNSGSPAKPVWSEKKDFFRGIPKIMHAAPAVFDIDGDGKWELIVGGFDGYVKGFRYETGQNGNPVWQRIEKLFDFVKVEGYASPSLVREKDKTYLFVGQQDGKISIFTANPAHWRNQVFYPDDCIEGVQVKNHSCPAVFERMGFIELSVGDYNGNLKHFACRRETREIKGN
jgi:hypothetical protein